MAEITQTFVVDDFDPTQGADETILWAFDGEALRSDLTEANVAALRAAVEPFVAVARKLGKQQVGTGKPRKRRSPRRTAGTAPAAKEPSYDPFWYRAKRNGPSKVESAKKRYRDMARTWGEENGYEVGFRISPELVKAFETSRKENGLPLGPAAVGLE